VEIKTLYVIGEEGKLGQMLSNGVNLINIMLKIIKIG
jgi:hypothetical protein